MSRTASVNIRQESSNRGQSSDQLSPSLPISVVANGTPIVSILRRPSDQSRTPKSVRIDLQRNISWILEDEASPPREISAAPQPQPQSPAEEVESNRRPEVIDSSNEWEVYDKDSRGFYLEETMEICPHCKKTLASYHAVERHMRREHSDVAEKVYSCSECHHHTRSPRGLEHHWKKFCPVGTINIRGVNVGDIWYGSKDYPSPPKSSKPTRKNRSEANGKTKDDQSTTGERLLRKRKALDPLAN